MSTLNYYKHKPYDPKHGGADQIVDWSRSTSWHGAGVHRGSARRYRAGGKRSASYCLGVLQAMANERVLQKFYYLTTGKWVDGGALIP